MQIQGLLRARMDAYEWKPLADEMCRDAQRFYWPKTTHSAAAGCALVTL